MGKLTENPFERVEKEGKNEVVMNSPIVMMSY